MHAGQFPQDLGVPEPKDAIAFGVDEGCAALVVLRLRVLTAVDFDNEHSVAARKIGDVWTDWILADELQSIDASVANEIPEVTFGRGDRHSQLASSHDGVCRTDGPHPALRAALSPVGRGDDAL